MDILEDFETTAIEIISDDKPSAAIPELYDFDPEEVSTRARLLKPRAAWALSALFNAADRCLQRPTKTLDGPYIAALTTLVKDLSTKTSPDVEDALTRHLANLPRLGIKNTDEVLLSVLRKVGQYSASQTTSTLTDKLAASWADAFYNRYILRGLNEQVAAVLSSSKTEALPLEVFRAAIQLQQDAILCHGYRTKTEKSGGTIDTRPVVKPNPQ